MLSLAIFEPEPRGHHLILHARFIIREALSRGWKVHLVTSERATKDKTFEALQSEFGDKFTYSLMQDVVNEETTADKRKLVQHFARWKAFRDGYRDLAEKPDVVYSISVEKLDLPTAALGSPFGKTPFCGLLLLRYFHCPHMGIKTEPLGLRDRIMERAFWRLLRIKTLRSLLTLDPNLAKFANESGRRGAQKVHYLPDVASFASLTPVENPKAKLGLPADSFTILNFGALTPRKGIEELLAALREPECPENVVVLLAGRQDAATQEIMKSDSAQVLIKAGRVIEINRFLDFEDENLAFSAADAVWLGYRRFYGMSGVLVQSASAGRPVLATDEGLVGHLTGSHNLGITVSIKDAGAVAKAIRELVEKPQAFAESGPAFAKNHTPDLFGRRVCDFIQQVSN